MNHSDHLQEASKAMEQSQDPTAYVRAALQYVYEMGRAEMALSLNPQRSQKIIELVAKTADQRYADSFDTQAKEAFDIFMHVMGIEAPQDLEVPQDFVKAQKKPHLTLIQGGAE